MRKYFPIVILVIFTSSLILFLSQKPSIWFDEYFWGIAYLKAPSLSTFIRLVGTQGPEVAPLYLTTFYIFVKLFGISPDAFRLFSVVVSIFTVIFAYRLFKFFFRDEIVCLLSTMAIATIPTFLWYSMLLRPHALGFSLSICSLYLFFSLIKLNRIEIKASQSLVLIFVNALLVLTYYIYVWLVFFEALVLFYSIFNSRSKKILLLGLVNAFLGCLVLLYFKMFANPSNVAYTFQVNLFSIFNYAFGIFDDEVPRFGSFAILIYRIFGCSEFTDTIARTIDKVSVYFLKGGDIVFGIILLFYFSMELLTYTRNKKTISSKLPEISLICLAFLVPLFFVGFSLVTKIPVMTIRFLLPALFVRWGLLIDVFFRLTSSKKVFKVFLFLVLVVYISVQYLMYQQNKPYTAWRECTDSLSQEVNGKDVFIIAHQEITPIFYSHWCSRLGYPEPILVSAGSLHLATDALVYLIKHLPPDYNVWLILRTEYGRLAPLIRKEWENNRLVYFTVKEFPFFEGLAYFGFRVEDNLKNTVDEVGSELELKGELPKEVAVYLEPCFGDEVETVDRIILSRYLGTDEVIERGSLIQFAMDWISIGKSCWVENSLKPARNISSWVSFPYALSLLETNPDEAEEVFNKCKRLNVFFYYTMKPIWNALKGKEYRSLAKESEKLMNNGFWPAHYLNHFAKHKLENSQCILPLGCFPYSWKSEQELKKIFRNEPSTSNNRIVEMRYQQVLSLMKYRDNFGKESTSQQ